MRDALARFERTGEPWCGSTDPQPAGNGSLMRLAPVPLFFASDPARRHRTSRRTARGRRTARVEAVDACRYFAGAASSAPSRAARRSELLAPGFTPVDGLWDGEPLAPAIAAIAAGSFRDREPPTIRGTGYVVRSLEAALWAFAKSTTFEDGALLAVNLGDDADTTGAIYGQIAGAHYGVEGIPARWREKLAARETIERLADGVLRD